VSKFSSEIKLTIIQEALRHGISVTCRRHSISRTLFYRWLRRYQEHGLQGLDSVRAACPPHNKTARATVDNLLALLKKNPRLGPRELKYRLESIGCHLSESAVYNILKRHELTRRKARLRYSRGIHPPRSAEPPPLEEIQVGECWLMWATPFGRHDGIGEVYEYTVLDYKSRVACSRVHSTFLGGHSENLLSAVALPIAQCLDFELKHFVFMDTCGMKDSDSRDLMSHVQDILHSSGLNVALYRHVKHKPLPELDAVREAYTRNLSATLIPHLLAVRSLPEVRLAVQQFLRRYNFRDQLEYEHATCSPLEYVTKTTGIAPILPLWAYIDRVY